MLLAHALTLAQARSHIAALADRAKTIDATVEYERVLLQLDWIHSDHIPGLSAVSTDFLFEVAEAAIEELVEFGVDALQVELILDMLLAAREKDTP